MDELLTRFWQEIVARPDGPFAFRFYLQPLMASIFAIRDGMADARQDKPAFLWSVLTQPSRRRERLREGWGSVGRIFIFAAAMDLVYQAVVLQAFRPVETIVVAALLALVPYALLRGPVNRIAKGMRGPRPRRRAA